MVRIEGSRTSVASLMGFRIEPNQLDPCDGCGELPIDACVLVVSECLPRFDLASDNVDDVDSPVQTLRADRRSTRFRPHSASFRASGCRRNRSDPIAPWPCPRQMHRTCDDMALWRIQVVHDQRDLLRAFVLVCDLLKEMGPVPLCSSFRDPDHALSGQGLACEEHRSFTAAPVGVVVSGHPSRQPRNRDPRLGDQWLGRFVRADHETQGIERSLVRRPGPSPYERRNCCCAPAESPIPSAARA